MLTLEIAFMAAVLKQPPYVFVAGSRSEIICSIGRVLTLLFATVIAIEAAPVGPMASVMVS